MTTKIGEHYVCDDCGAVGDKPENIRHYVTCKPGEKWREFHERMVDVPGDSLE